MASVRMISLCYPLARKLETFAVQGFKRISVTYDGLVFDSGCPVTSHSMLDVSLPLLASHFISYASS